jgi:MFS family permease
MLADRSTISIANSETGQCRLPGCMLRQLTQPLHQGRTRAMSEGAGGSRSGSAGRRPPWVSPGVASVGAASFFSDAGHEIATAVLPGFLTGVLGGSAATLGLIEGLSDALLGLAKLVSGPLANQPARRVQLARGGYLLTAVCTAAIGLATTVWQAGVLRAAAWVARGARTPARDAMLAGLAPPEAYGRAFGVERAGDNLGAVVGPLLASILAATVGIRTSFLFALIPGALAAVAISVAAAQARPVATAVPVRARARLGLVGLRRAGLLRPLLPVALFEVGNITTTLLILRATQLLEQGGRSPTTAAAAAAIVLYAGHNLTAAIVALAGGTWIDRRGPRPAFAAGAAAYVLAYGGFAFPIPHWPLLAGWFGLAGAGIGLAEPAESTLVAQLLPDRLRGSGLGSWVGCSRPATFCPRRSWACCMWRLPQRWGSCTPRPGWSSRSPPPSGSATASPGSQAEAGPGSPGSAWVVWSRAVGRMALV